MTLEMLHSPESVFGTAADFSNMQQELEGVLTEIMMEVYDSQSARMTEQVVESAEEVDWGGQPASSSAPPPPPPRDPNPWYQAPPNPGRGLPPTPPERPPLRSPTRPPGPPSPALIPAPPPEAPLT